MPGPFVHQIDPVIVQVGGVYLWWYGLSYTLGFLNIHWWLRRRRAEMGLSLGDVYVLSVLFCGGVLVGGRVVEVVFDEWPFYREHPALIPAFWLGGMATHGLLLGAAAGTWLFARLRRQSFRSVADALVVPGAFLLGVGRIGNFVDGQIVGAVTDGWWGVQFPDRDGVRHPVVLYDGVKNLLLVPYLASVRRRHPRPGATAARFVFWYAFLRIFIDVFRDYPTHRLPLGTGQTLNIVMALVGVALLWRSRRRRLPGTAPPAAAARPASAAAGGRGWRFAFAALVSCCLAIPSNWTQDVPARYGRRHAGMQHSRLYPAIDTAPAPAAAESEAHRK
ncbi:MAG TPA: prolipoprotein diacylglyceryl transferase [Vicinamibacterales bacterium]|nr:prolipoprotein diacylglyceryl transferase [Vicinamibacterales bacterium]